MDKNSIRWFFVSLLLTIALETFPQSSIRVVEAESGEALEAATVFAKDGHILGFSDKNGEFNRIRTEDYPLRITYMGYDPVILNPGESSTVIMTPATYLLNEVTVIPGQYPVQRIVCYMREYLSGMTHADSLLYFNEHMVDFFLVKGKVKGFKQKNHPRILSSRLYARICDEHGDSIFMPQYRDDMLAWEQIISLPEGQIEIVEMANAGASHAKIEGKYSTKELFTVTPHTLIRNIDFLADTKDHTMSPLIFKILGFTIDFNEIQNTWVYERNESDKYDLTNIISGTFSVKVKGRGKFLKKIFKTDQPIEMYASYEIYPVEIEYLTVEDAKELLKNQPVPEIKMSKNAAPLPPQILRMIECLNGNAGQEVQ